MEKVINRYMHTNASLTKYIKALIIEAAEKNNKKLEALSQLEKIPGVRSLIEDLLVKLSDKSGKIDFKQATAKQLERALFNRVYYNGLYHYFRKYTAFMRAIRDNEEFRERAKRSIIIIKGKRSRVHSDIIFDPDIFKDFQPAPMIVDAEDDELFSTSMRHIIKADLYNRVLSVVKNIDQYNALMRKVFKE